MKDRFSIFALLAALTAVLFSCTPEEGTHNPDPENPGYVRVVPDPLDWNGEKGGSISYQLLVYSFADSDGDGIGDLNGVTSKLDYLDSLGISAIWLSPIHPSMSYHGYDVLDYDAVNPDFGTKEDFRNLVKAAHDRDIKIYIDYVLNHSGSDHPWFLDAASSKDSPYRDWYIFSENPEADIAAGNIPMIATEGDRGYDAGQWYASSTTETKRLEFVLDWSDSNAPVLTLTETTSPADEPNPDTDTEGAKYIYFGDPAKYLKFYDDGDGMYSLTVDFSSPWGFLIRTENNDNWNPGTKYGAKDAAGSMIAFGEPFVLFTSSDNNAVKDIRLPGSTFFHSHFWTDWFADLNYGSASACENSGAFRELVRIGGNWVDAGIDGMRLDAVKHIYHNANSDENPVFLSKFYNAMDAMYDGEDPFYMVGEVFSEHNEAAPYYKGLPAVFEFSFWWRLSNAINSGDARNFVKDLISYRSEYASYRKDFIAATKLSNHDENRAGSDLEESVAKMRLAAAVLMTADGEPYIYYGEELGYTGTKANGDEMVRTPMNWGDDYNTSIKAYCGKPDVALKDPVAAQAADSTSVFRVYKDFALARNAYQVLGKGTMVRHDLFNENLASIPSLCAWYMEYGDEKALVLHNFGSTSINFLVRDSLDGVMAVQGKVSRMTEDEGTRVMMDGYSSVVFGLE